MAFSALAPDLRRRRTVEAVRRPEPRSELHPVAPTLRVEDRMLPVRARPPAITPIYPPLYRPEPAAVPRPSGVNRTALPPVVAQRGAPAVAPTPAAAMPETPEMELPANLKKHARLVQYKGKGALVGRVYEIPAWLSWSQTRRLAFMREFTEDKARDPHIAAFTTKILREAGCDGRDLRKGWAVLLAWVQKNVTYVNEPNERLQSPQATLQLGFGDCDDLAILLRGLGHSLRWPSRWVLSGRVRKTGQKVRWIEGQAEPATGIDWAHIYLLVGGPPFKPTWWTYAEPTLQVPLGWDVVGYAAKGGGNALPELAGPSGGEASMHGAFAGEIAIGAPDAPTAMLPITNPLYNVRELAKELTLLEDHLYHPPKRCPDCIRKHLLRAEALAEEAITLDTGRKHGALLAPLPEAIRSLCRKWKHKTPPVALAEDVRRLRKQLTPAGFAALGAPDAPASSTRVASPVSASTVVVPSATWTKAVSTLRGIAWLNLLTASIPPIFAAWFTHRYIVAQRRK